MLNNLRLSVLTIWPFRLVDGTTTADQDLSTYRSALNGMRYAEPDSTYRLPWPKSKNWFWTYQLGSDYRNLKSSALVRNLVPMRHVGTIPQLGAPNRSEVLLDVLRWPFAVTAAAHFDLLQYPNLHVDDGLETLLGDVLTATWPGTQIQVRDGVPFTFLPALPQDDADGEKLELGGSRAIFLISGVHHGEQDPSTTPARLVAMMQGRSNLPQSAPLRSEDAFLALAGDWVALLLPRKLPDAAKRVACLHGNTHLLLSTLASLLPACTRSAATPLMSRYAEAAKEQLACLYARTPSKASNSIYESRLAQMWLDEQQWRGHQA